MVKVIPPSTNIFLDQIYFADPGTTFQSTNQIWETSSWFVKFRLTSRDFRSTVCYGVRFKDKVI